MTWLTRERRRLTRIIAKVKAFCFLHGLLVVSADDDADKDTALANYRVYVAVLTQQRDAARQDLAIFQAQLGQDMLELCGERDDWKEAAEARGASLKVLLAAVRQRGFCMACDNTVDRCPEVCAARAAYVALAPVMGESAIGEA